MKLYLKKLISHPIRNKIVLFLLFWPSVEIIYYLYQIICYGGGVRKPYLTFFLTGNSSGLGHLVQSILLWFLPLYLLIIAGEDILEELKTGYYQIMIGKTGKKNYVKTHMKKAFFLGFITIFCALLLNLLLVHIIFAGGMNDYSAGIIVESGILKTLYQFPVLAEIIFSAVTAWFSGLIAMTGAILAIAIQDRKWVYSITMVVWLLPFMMKNSSMLLFQPFSEYDIDILGSVFVGMSVVYLLIVLILFIREVYYGD